ncbi:hypothetical protein Pint_26029 [Pistacia integerrima]|uniref:Uncharacterized protein n=1 Tax=Pistacia integerrima TaxID=434235 RepID=A0ACC0YDN2_9ROSI|nr:hypothetical protein Pint_26029 [Pistacia integerrima]
MARTNPVTKTPSNSLGFLLLKSHKAAGYLTSIASTFFSLGSVIRRRVTSGRTDADTERGKESGNRALKSRGWHFGAPKLQLEFIFASPLGIKGLFDLLYSRWVLIHVEYLAPPLQFLANACTVRFLIQSLDRLILCLVVSGSA